VKHLALVLALGLVLAGCQAPVPASQVPVQPTGGTTATARTAASTQAAPTSPPPATAAPTRLPAQATASPAASERVTLVLGAASGPVEVRAEVANTEPQREVGLMFRRSLADGEGMLFVFPAATTGAFWMQNTLVPLSIAWIAADGTILGLDDMAPQTETLHYPPGAYRYALEVPQGFYARRGVKPGDKIGYLEGGGQRPLSQLPQVALAR
jgi:uncharacterized protein